MLPEFLNTQEGLIRYVFWTIIPYHVDTQAIRAWILKQEEGDHVDTLLKDEKGLVAGGRLVVIEDRSNWLGKSVSEQSRINKK